MTEKRRKVVDLCCTVSGVLGKQEKENFGAPMRSWWPGHVDFLNDWRFSNLATVTKGLFLPSFDIFL